MNHKEHEGHKELKTYDFENFVLFVVKHNFAPATHRVQSTSAIGFRNETPTPPRLPRSGDGTPIIFRPLPPGTLA